MKRLWRKDPRDPGRICAYCGVLLFPDSPMYLVTQQDGALVGPYHADCAAKIKLRGKHLKPGEKLAGLTFGRVYDHLAQEELEL